MSYTGAYNKIIHKLENEIPSTLTYHNVKHAKRVLHALDNHLLTLEMAPRKEEIVRLAALSHDMGFIDTYEGHEYRSIKLLKPILSEEGYSEEEIHEISAIIWATKLDIKPRTFMEKMVVDADLEYLGSDDYNDVVITT